jgi:hypothetical protein
MMATVKNIILIVAEIKMYWYDTTFGFRKKYGNFLSIEILLTNLIIIIIIIIIIRPMNFVNAILFLVIS